MGFDFLEDKPIYLQILKHLKMQIISKKYLPGQKIPSVRELSFFYEVNPNTVQKALLELELQGIIVTESTNGKFVTKNVAVIDTAFKQTVDEMVENFFESMQDVGLSKEEVIKFLKDKENL